LTCSPLSIPLGEEVCEDVDMRSARFRTILALAAIQLCCPGNTQEPRKSQTPTAELIRQLDADRFRDREAAHRELLKRAEAPALLHRSLPKLDFEGKRRAAAIIEAFVKPRRDQVLRFARDGRVDLLAEWSALVGSDIDPAEFWQCVLGAGWRELD